MLNGKTALIAGGSSGINLGIAFGLAEAGAKVAVLSRDQGRIQSAAAELREAGHEAIGLAADVRDYSAVEAAFATIQELWGDLSVVVSGAAGNFLAPASDLSSNGFRTVIDIDLIGTFNVFRASYPHLVKPGASLIAISAGLADNPTANQVHACAAKAGVNMVTRCLALEWGSVGVRVNGIAPGPIADTEGMRRLAPTEDATAKLARSVPLGRYGYKSEIADLAVFLSSEHAAYITGAVIPCDGGLSITGSKLGS